MNSIQLIVETAGGNHHIAIFDTKVSTSNHGDGIRKGVADVNAIDNDIARVAPLDDITGQPRTDIAIEHLTALVSGEIGNICIGSPRRSDNGISSVGRLSRQEARPCFDYRCRANARQFYVVLENQVTISHESASR